MTQQLIVNTPPGSGTGDPATTAFNKVNSNFTELYTTLKQSAAELAAGVAPVSYGYAPGNVLRYGADPTGVLDSTSAWLAALAQRQHGGEKIVFPAGLYKGNFVVTGQNVTIVTEEPFYEDVATVGFIANNLTLPVWTVGDGVTNTTSIKFEGGLKMHGKATAAYGLLINGAYNVWFDSLISRGFTGYSFNYTASTTQPSAYCFINNYRIDCAPSASAIGFVMTQPANFPTSYATALFFNHGAISAVAGALWGVQINANSTCYVENSYWSMRDGAGINFSDPSSTGIINFSNVIIDNLAGGNEVMVTCAGTFPLNQNMRGSVTINGKCSINGNISAVNLGGAGYLGYRTMMHFPSVIGSIDFQDNSAGPQDQTVYGLQPPSLSRSGGNFFIKNNAGPVLVQSSYLDVTNAAGTADAPIKYGISGIQILTGSGSPAVSTADGSLYLQTDAGASSPLWVRKNGAWVNATLP